MIGLEYIKDLYNMSLQDVGEKLGISKQTIHKWIKKEKKIADSRLEELEKVFNIPEEYFQKELTEVDMIEIQKIKLLNELDNGLNNFNGETRKGIILDLINKLNNKL